MSVIGRRGLLKGGSGLVTAGLLSSINRALAIPAERRSGTLEDVEHIVVLMQENRSFDHYFGHLNGVRGVGDRHPVRSPDGTPVWSQWRAKPENGRVLPFQLRTHVTSAQCVLDLDHNWAPTHAAINAGWNDQWPRHKTDMTMGYYTREDIPYHYALADAFTVCDHYFCSTPTQTHPNRFYLMTGTVDGEGVGGGPVLDNVDWVDRAFYPKVPGPFNWTTYPERLEAAGVSWQVYQQGLSPADVENGNFGTNVLMNFRNYVDAPETSPLYQRAMTKRTLDTLRQDVLADRLPQVSWLLPPAAYSEHPRWTPGYGATYIARVLNALTANPDVWAKTVLLVMYDENDGYFDHVPPPQPPTPVLPGKSTVDTRGEIHDRLTPHEPKRYTADMLPYGLGPRVPMLALSPWSTGGFVCSEVFDHTSVLRFIEARFGVRETNITPWRRSVCGDLTSAFDFSRKQGLKGNLPDTADYRSKTDQSCKLPDPAVPVQSSLSDIGEQEKGHRPTRPLPYILAVNEVDGPAGACTLQFENHGTAGACFYVYQEQSDEKPRRYTVGAGASLQDQWHVPAGGMLRLMVLGPNGFARYFHRKGRPDVSVSVMDQTGAGAIVVKLTNHTNRPQNVQIQDNAYGMAKRTVVLPARGVRQEQIGLAGSHHWYDVTVFASAEPNVTSRFAGHVETGSTGVTDPAAGKPLLHG
ncbi:MAG: phospholipase C, phosphocholine-specific [Acetobacter persici]|uniref:phosphocholine-specific phospholipase C n=1 Tax=Acetobacter persici TaxID=1076596 RepID=UPI0039E75E22